MKPAQWLLIVMAAIFGTTIPATAECGGSGDCRARSLLDAARSLRLDTGFPDLAPSVTPPASDFGQGPWIWDLLRRHRYHLLGVVLMNQADYQYEKRIGPRDDPLLFGSPGSLDRAISDRFGEGSQPSSFLIKNKTSVLRAVSLGAMLAGNGRDWEGLSDDFIGLVEADKFNWAASSLVKTIVGRRRPSLERALESGLEPVEESDPDASTRRRDSFYSDSASRAFTYMAYTDSILARRFKGRPWARSLGAFGLYGLAGYVAYSRVEQGRHYLTDVVAGAGAGFLVGKTFYRINHRDESEAADAGGARVTFQPVLLPGGAGATMSIQF